MLATSCGELKRGAGLTPAHPGSSFSFFATQNRKLLASKIMNGVPGVIAFWSQLFLFLYSSGTSLPIASHSAMAFCLSSSFCLASCDDLNRRERCWFILARGATPSMAITRSLRGRTMATTRSV
jgi:hypothetical protein